MELELKTSKFICEFPGGVNFVAPVMSEGNGGAAAGGSARARATDSMYLEQFPPNGVIDNDWSIHSQFDSKLQLYLPKKQSTTKPNLRNTEYRFGSVRSRNTEANILDIFWPNFCFFFK